MKNVSSAVVSRWLYLLHLLHVDSASNGDEEADEPVLPAPMETSQSLSFKLTLLEMYNQRVEKRHENKAIMFERGLLNYKQVRLMFLSKRYFLARST